MRQCNGHLTPDRIVSVGIQIPYLSCLFVIVAEYIPRRMRLILHGKGQGHGLSAYYGTVIGVALYIHRGDYTICLTLGHRAHCPHLLR